MVKKIFYDFLHVNVIPTVSFEEATNKEIIQMTPFITEEEEKKSDRPSLPAKSDAGILPLLTSRLKEIPSKKGLMK